MTTSCPAGCPLDDLLRQSDIVSLHVPLTAETRHLIGERELRLMKPTATLVNAARGPVVDEVALGRALREGWIGSAGLDVQDVEPNPDPNAPLLQLPNCVVLPHIGSATRAAREAMIGMAIDNAVAFLRGQPLITPVGRVRPLPADRSSDGNRCASRAVGSIPSQAGRRPRSGWIGRRGGREDPHASRRSAR